MLLRPRIIEAPLPPEPIYALIYSVEDATNTQQSDRILSMWKHVLLTSSAAIEAVPPGEARYWRAQNLRQELIEIGDLSKLTVREQISDVAGFKSDKERELGRNLSSQLVAQMWQDNVKFARCTEKVSTSFVDSAITVGNRVLKVAGAKAVLEYCDDKNLEIITSVYVLQAIVDRAKTEERIVWALEGLVDHYRMGHINKGDFVVSKLRGPKTSYVEVLNSKLEVKNHMLYTWLPRSRMHADSIKLIQAKCGSFDVARQNLTNFPDHAPFDSSWQYKMCH